MKGLLIKDLRLLKNQKQYLMTILFIALIFAATGQNLYFIISYCTIVASFFAVTSVGYDEHGNGFWYLFTLPVSRRGYAVEKYVFALLIGGGTWILTTAVAAIYTWIQAPGTNMAEWLIGAVAEFLALEGMVMILLPVQLKFGAEKSRIATMILSFGIFSVIMLIADMIKSAKLDLDIGWIYRISVPVWCMIGLGVFAVAALISMTVSIRIMEHKKF